MLGAVAVPLGVLGSLGVVCGALVLAGWRKADRILRRRFSGALALQWVNAPAFSPGPEVEARVAALQAELQGLAYRPAGFLADSRDPNIYYAVSVHETLPAYAFLMVARMAGRALIVPYLLSFFEDGGRITTTASRHVGGYTAGLDTGAPQLLQLRDGGTPTALDGQHMGTLKAWIAGGRRPVPAAREALLETFGQEHERLRAAFHASGGLSLAAYVRALFGTPPGVLRF